MNQLRQWIREHSDHAFDGSPRSRVARAKANDPGPAPVVTLPGLLSEIPRDARCDRCAHKLREHAGPALGSICQVGRGRDTRRLCPCDGFTVEEKLA